MLKSIREVDHIEIVTDPPSVHEFLHLREEMGWGLVESSQAEKGLSASLYCICLYHDRRLLAMGRVVGDGALYFYIQDVMVSVPYQGNGLGRIVMDNIMDFIHTNAHENEHELKCNMFFQQPFLFVSSFLL